MTRVKGKTLADEKVALVGWHWKQLQLMISCVCAFAPMYGSIRVNIRDKLAFSAYHQWLILYEAIFLSGVSMIWDLSKVSFRQVGWITVTGNAGTTFASAREAHDPQPELIKKSVD